MKNTPAEYSTWIACPQVRAFMQRYVMERRIGKGKRQSETKYIVSKQQSSAESISRYDRTSCASTYNFIHSYIDE